MERGDLARKRSLLLVHYLIGRWVMTVPSALCCVPFILLLFNNIMLCLYTSNVFSLFLSFSLVSKTRADARSSSSQLSSSTSLPIIALHRIALHRIASQNIEEKAEHCCWFLRSGQSVTPNLNRTNGPMDETLLEKQQVIIASLISSASEIDYQLLSDEFCTLNKFNYKFHLLFQDIARQLPIGMKQYKKNCIECAL